MSALFFPHSPARKIGTWFAPGVHVQQKHHGEALSCAADALEAWLRDEPAPETYTSASGPRECELCAQIRRLGGHVRLCVQCGVQELEPVHVPHTYKDTSHRPVRWELTGGACTGWCQECDSVVLLPHDPTHTVFLIGDK